jgi:hypothetical protein
MEGANRNSNTWVETSLTSPGAERVVRVAIEEDHDENPKSTD